GNGKIYVQKLDQSGKNQWVQNGVQVGDAVAGKNFGLTAKGLLALQSGGLTIAYQTILEPSNSSAKSLKMTQINANGTLVFQGRESTGSMINADINNAVIGLSEDDLGNIKVVYNQFRNEGLDPLRLKNFTAVGSDFEKLLVQATREGSKVSFDAQNRHFVFLLDRKSVV